MTKVTEGFLVGFFVVASPISISAGYSLAGAMVHCIIGLFVAIIIEVGSR